MDPSSNLYRMTELKKMLDRIERATLRYLQEISSRLERMDLRQIRMDEKLNKILEHQD